MQQKSSDLLTIQKTKNDTTMKQNEIIDDTKIIIVSDINGSNQSILPYGLKLARHLQAEVDIVHVVDARVQQGVPSRYADSQSLTPEPKLTFDNIVEREIKQANINLDKVLNKEVSRLNFPLKINKKIREGSINEGIKESVANAAKCLVLINLEADDYIFNSLKEIIQFTKSINSVTLLVPPKLVFNEFEQVVMITDFSNNYGINAYSKIFSFLDKFSLHINVVDVAKPARFLEKEVKSKQWMQTLDPATFRNIKTEVLKGENHSDALLKYVDMVKPQLIIYSYRQPGFFRQLFHKPFFENILNKANYPIMYLV